MPPCSNKSRQSFTSADILPKAHSACSRTASSLVSAMRWISKGIAPHCINSLAWWTSAHAMLVIAQAASNWILGASDRPSNCTKRGTTPASTISSTGGHLSSLWMHKRRRKHRNREKEQGWQRQSVVTRNEKGKD